MIENKKVLEVLNSLSNAQKEELINFMQSLQKPIEKTQADLKEELQSIINTVSSEDICAMKQAIEADCENINENEW